MPFGRGLSKLLSNNTLVEQLTSLIYRSYSAPIFIRKICVWCSPQQTLSVRLEFICTSAIPRAISLSGGGGSGVNDVAMDVAVVPHQGDGHDEGPHDVQTQEALPVRDGHACLVNGPHQQHGHHSLEPGEQPSTSNRIGFPCRILEGDFSNSPEDLRQGEEADACDADEELGITVRCRRHQRPRREDEAQ